jgi:hypothetical protein
VETSESPNLTVMASHVGEEGPSLTEEHTRTIIDPELGLSNQITRMLRSTIKFDLGLWKRSKWTSGGHIDIAQWTQKDPEWFLDLANSFICNRETPAKVPLLSIDGHRWAPERIGKAGALARLRINISGLDGTL